MAKKPLANRSFNKSAESLFGGESASNVVKYIWGTVLFTFFIGSCGIITNFFTAYLIKECSANLWHIRTGVVAKESAASSAVTTVVQPGATTEVATTTKVPFGSRSIIDPYGDQSHAPVGTMLFRAFSSKEFKNGNEQSEVPHSTLTTLITLHNTQTLLFNYAFAPLPQ